MPEPNTRRVLVAIDGSKYSEKAFDYCLSLPTKKEWELKLHKAETKAKEMLAKFEKKCIELELAFMSIYAHGPIGQVICTAAKEEKVELIVLGNRGLGTIRRTVFGTVCDYVTQCMPVPVLMVPTED